MEGVLNRAASGVGLAENVGTGNAAIPNMVYYSMSVQVMRQYPTRCIIREGTRVKNAVGAGTNYWERGQQYREILWSS